MERTLIIGASGGIGRALVTEAEARGHSVLTLARRETGMDLRDPSSVTRALDRIEGHLDRIVIATGVLAPKGSQPEKSLSRLQASAMAEVMAINAIGPAIVLGALPRLLRRDGRAEVGVLSARVGSIGDNRLGGWHSYRASKAALNMILRGAAIEIARTHPRAILAALHPGTVDTPFTAAYGGREKMEPRKAASSLLDVLAGLRPDQSGGFYDYAGREIPW